MGRSRHGSFDLLFAIMAVQEVVFFAPVARRLMEEEGLRVAFLTFHEAGDDILDREGIPYFSLHKLKDEVVGRRVDLPSIEDVEKDLAIHTRRLVVHEMLTTNRRREEYLTFKVRLYYHIMDSIFKDNTIGCVVQELGGFIAPQLLYYVARKYGVNHVFIEPAMFPKRVVFTLNELYADFTGFSQGREVTENVRRLVEEYRAKKTVVIPKKDRHFFQDMNVKRLLAFDNFRRLARKLYHKYIIGRREEYNAILWYCTYQLIKFFRRKALTLYYSLPREGERYVYFPFHVPLDVQLTVRCPEFLNQEALVDYIARSIPMGYRLYVKEHPAAIGAHPVLKIRDLVRLGNVRLIHPSCNSFDLIKNAGCVITINSKVGFEAIMQGRPVIVLGKAFYRGKGVTIDIEDIRDLPQALKKALSQGYKVEEEKRLQFIQQAFEWSYKGELYENSVENLEAFYNSLRDFLLGSGAVTALKKVGP